MNVTGFVCRKCGHRAAMHCNDCVPDRGDYVELDTAAAVEALALVRRRQSLQEILAALHDKGILLVYQGDSHA